MPTCQYNCVELPEHELINCNEWLKGGIPTIGVLECDHNIAAFTSAADTNQAITDEELTLITNIKATYNEPAEITGENPIACGSENILDGFDHILSWKDFNVRSENNTHYAALNQRRTYLLWYECETGLLKVVEREVTWMVKPALVPESNKEKQHYIGQAMWSGNVDDFYVIYTAPAGVYD
jgi:hypothetical protein